MNICVIRLNIIAAMVPSGVIVVLFASVLLPSVTPRPGPDAHVYSYHPYYGYYYDHYYGECTYDSDCSYTTACYANYCRNPCAGACGTRANCKVIN